MPDGLTASLKLWIMKFGEARKLGFADMHIHSIYSDGSLDPSEIVKTARANGVELISVCDHNEIRGTLETVALARAAGLKSVTGVEIDAMFEGLDIHILCYGARLDDAPLLSRIRHAREKLDGMSTDLLLRMKPDYPRLDLEEYNAWTHDVRRGGWKMLQYLQAKGVAGDMKAAMPLYDRYGVTYAGAGFDAAEDVIRAIHDAGGRAVLAHPGVVFAAENLRDFAARVEAAMELGLDGIECYYPRHSAGVARCCLEICRRRGAMVTAGSDCHGAFNRNEIGQTRTSVDALILNELQDSIFNPA